MIIFLFYYKNDYNFFFINYIKTSKNNKKKLYLVRQGRYLKVNLIEVKKMLLDFVSAS